MWGLGIYLMHLADYLRGRTYKIQCRTCGRTFKNDRELDVHIRTDHRYSMWVYSHSLRLLVYHTKEPIYGQSNGIENTKKYEILQYHTRQIGKCIVLRGNLETAWSICFTVILHFHKKPMFLHIIKSLAYIAFGTSIKLIPVFGSLFVYVGTTTFYTVKLFDQNF